MTSSSVSVVMCVFQTTVGLSVSSCLSVDSQATSSILSAPGLWPHPTAPFQKDGVMDGKSGWWLFFLYFALSAPPPLVFLSCTAEDIQLPAWMYTWNVLYSISCPSSFPFLFISSSLLAFYFHPQRFSRPYFNSNLKVKIKKVFETVPLQLVGYVWNGILTSTSINKKVCSMHTAQCLLYAWDTLFTSSYNSANCMEYCISQCNELNLTFDMEFLIWPKCKAFLHKTGLKMQNNSSHFHDDIADSTCWINNVQHDEIMWKPFSHW